MNLNRFHWNFQLHLLWVTFFCSATFDSSSATRDWFQRHLMHFAFRPRGAKVNQSEMIPLISTGDLMKLQSSSISRIDDNASLCVYRAHTASIWSKRRRRIIRTTYVGNVYNKRSMLNIYQLSAIRSSVALRTSHATRAPIQRHSGTFRACVASCSHRLQYTARERDTRQAWARQRSSKTTHRARQHTKAARRRPHE